MINDAVAKAGGNAWPHESWDHVRRYTFEVFEQNRQPAEMEGEYKIADAASIPATIKPMNIQRRLGVAYAATGDTAAGKKWLLEAAKNAQPTGADPAIALRDGHLVHRCRAVGAPGDRRLSGAAQSRPAAGQSPVAPRPPAGHREEGPPRRDEGAASRREPAGRPRGQHRQHPVAMGRDAVPNRGRAQSGGGHAGRPRPAQRSHHRARPGAGPLAPRSAAPPGAAQSAAGVHANPQPPRRGAEPERRQLAHHLLPRLVAAARRDGKAGARRPRAAQRGEPLHRRRSEAARAGLAGARQPQHEVRFHPVRDRRQARVGAAAPRRAELSHGRSDRRLEGVPGTRSALPEARGQALRRLPPLGFRSPPAARRRAVARRRRAHPAPLDHRQ